jgi:hypothetical protein
MNRSLAAPLRSAPVPGGVAAALRSDAGFIAMTTGAALCLRVLYYLWAGSVDWRDTGTYLQAGRELLGAGRIESHLVMPLYPLFLLATGWRGVVWVQLLLSALLVPLVYLLARQVFDSKSIARGAAALMAIEPLSVLYASQRLTETLFTFVVCGAILALYQRRLWLASILMALSVLVRPTYDLLAPVLIVVFWVLHAERRKPAAAARSLAVYGLVYVLVMTPWWIHNVLKYDRFVRLNLGDGVVLRLEHNPLFLQWGFSWPRLEPVLEEFAAEKDPFKRNELRREAAFLFIAEDPARYVVLSVRRLGRFWSPFLDQGENWLPPLARWLFFAASCVVFVGVLAYAVQRRTLEWRAIAPLLLVIGYLTGVHAASHALPRYRVPIMPLVVVIAAAGWQRVASSRHGRTDQCGPAVAAAPATRGPRRLRA